MTLYFLAAPIMLHMFCRVKPANEINNVKKEL